jgi:hypothetical protein
MRSVEILRAKCPGKELPEGLDPSGRCDQEVITAELEEYLSTSATGLQEVSFSIDADECDQPSTTA